ncbi:hypothetical protein ColTof3_14647 [Colletotrichum tofieldiae]|nr:hypothetical protein ColTof3_14647 [Colletotrichum tofieldiae]
MSQLATSVAGFQAAGISGETVLQKYNQTKDALKMGSSTLLRLPPETLIAVAFALVEPCDPRGPRRRTSLRSLACLCLVSRAWHAIATPVLYTQAALADVRLFASSHPHSAFEVSPRTLHHHQVPMEEDSFVMSAVLSGDIGFLQRLLHHAPHLRRVGITAKQLLLLMFLVFVELPGKPQESRRRERPRRPRAANKREANANDLKMLMGLIAPP